MSSAAGPVRATALRAWSRNALEVTREPGKVAPDLIGMVGIGTGEKPDAARHGLGDDPGCGKGRATVINTRSIDFKSDVVFLQPVQQDLHLFVVECIEGDAGIVT